MTLTPDLALRHQRAADFFVRRREPDWTGADERELDAWLCDATNRAIYDGLAVTALDLQQIRRPGLSSDAVPRAPDGKRAAAAPRRPWLSRRKAWAPALLSALLLAGGGGYWWDHHPSYTLDVATGPGEMRAVALPDGTRVTLNFDSRLTVRYYPRRRDAELARGEAFFQVAPAAQQPFTVDSGTSQVRVVGTAFNLRSGPPQFVVKVLEGRVEVRPDRRRADAPVLQLGPGAGVSVDAASGRHTAVPVAADSVGDWRHGQLVFAQTPLAEVAAELARYLGRPVRVEGAKLAALPVSGLAITEAPAGFLRSLPMLLPVRVQDLGADGWRISAR